MTTKTCSSGFVSNYTIDFISNGECVSWTVIIELESKPLYNSCVYCARFNCRDYSVRRDYSCRRVAILLANSLPNVRDVTRCSSSRKNSGWYILLNVGSLLILKKKKKKTLSVLAHLSHTVSADVRHERNHAYVIRGQKSKRPRNASGQLSQLHLISNI